MPGLNGNADTDNAHERNADGARGGGVAAAVDVSSGELRSGAGNAGGQVRGVAHALVVETSNARNLLADMRDLLGDDAERRWKQRHGT